MGKSPDKLRGITKIDSRFRLVSTDNGNQWVARAKKPYTTIIDGQRHLETQPRVRNYWILNAVFNFLDSPRENA
jgi:hypothetical protein